MTYGPSASEIPGVEKIAEIPKEALKLPDINEHIEVPNSTPTSQFVPVLSVPTTSTTTEMDIEEINIPSDTDRV